MRNCWLAKAWATALLRKLLDGAIAQAKKRYKALQSRYGPRYTAAMMSAACFTFFLPIPGISLVSVAIVIMVAELHRVLSSRDRFQQAERRPVEGFRETSCDVNGACLIQPITVRSSD